MYKSERAHRKAAPAPAKRSMPFDAKDEFQIHPKAKNDPVGTEIYACNAYGLDKMINFVQRN